MMFERSSFRAMGTEVEVLGAPLLPEETVRRVRVWFEEVESRLSRFRPESELSLLNASGGRPFAASPMLRTVLREALSAARRSGGRFDPTVVDALEAHGYRTSLEEIRPFVVRRASTPPDYRNVRLRRDGSVLLLRGARVDLGGLAKGWTVDRAARLMGGVESWVVNAGGDLLARGEGPDGYGWLAGIEDPLRQGDDLGVIRLRDCAVATSTTTRRRWRTSEGMAHHLIDPSSGAPSATGVLSVTVVCARVAEAEVLAKTALLMGAARGMRFVESKGAGAVVVTSSGRVLWSRRMAAIREA